MVKKICIIHKVQVLGKKAIDVAAYALPRFRLN